MGKYPKLSIFLNFTTKENKYMQSEFVVQQLHMFAFLSDQIKIFMVIKSKIHSRFTKALFSPLFKKKIKENHICELIVRKDSG